MCCIILHFYHFLTDQSLFVDRSEYPILACSSWPPEFIDGDNQAKNLRASLRLQ
jgi:hypothetical protein